MYESEHPDVGVEAMRRALRKLIELTNSVLAALGQLRDGERYQDNANRVPTPVKSALVPLLLGIRTSTQTLLELCSRPGEQARDCYGIARSIVEAAINASYIVAEGPNVAEQALRHARQKSYRDTYRKSQVASSNILIGMLGAPSPSEVPGLERELAEFVSGAGREKAWTDLSVDDRIAVSGKTFGDRTLTPLHFARVLIYRHSSEILHGSVFGSLYFYGRTGPNQPNSREKLAEFLSGQQATMLLSVLLAINGLFYSLSEAYGFTEVSENAFAAMIEATTTYEETRPANGESD